MDPVRTGLNLTLCGLHLSHYHYYCKSTNFGVLLYLANLANCVFLLIFIVPTYVNYVDRTLHRWGDAKFNSREITLFRETPNFIAAKICWFTGYCDWSVPTWMLHKVSNLTNPTCYWQIITQSLLCNSVLFWYNLQHTKGTSVRTCSQNIRYIAQSKLNKNFLGAKYMAKASLSQHIHGN